MRKVLPSAQTEQASSDSMVAPTKGWNARDPIANMPPGFAIYMDNFFPSPSKLDVRKGRTTVATLPTATAAGEIRTLMEYNDESGTITAFAATPAGIYDITAGGTITVLGSAATNGEWQHVNMSTAGGTFLWCCNGVDKSRYYRAGTWTVLDGTSTPALLGITSANITNVFVHKRRLMFCEKDSLSFWYLPVDSVAGTAVEFPLGSVFNQGGYLMAIGAWTLDGGTGSDDYCVFVSSKGEVAIYLGTDPADANNWSLKGTFFIGKPMGRRCIIKYDSEVCVMTVKGLQALSQAMVLSDRNPSAAALSDKISGAWLDYTNQFGDLYGWQPIVFPEATMLLVNVPVLYKTSAPYAIYSYQFVMNTQTNAWSRFLGWDASVLATVDGKLYGASKNKVYQLWTGASDDGAAIQARVKTAFFYPKGRERISQISLLRHILSASGPIKLMVGVDTDYEEGTYSTNQVSIGYGGAEWDTARWDEAYWSLNDISATWRTVSHDPGKAVSLRLRVNLKDVNMAWNATDFILLKGTYR
jgi:hypothetical protein